MAEHVDIDAVDRRILELLRSNARRTVRDIAAEVHLSAAPVKRRIDRMETLGVIAGYTVVIDDRRLEPALEAFTELRFAGDMDVENMLDLVLSIPEVREAYTMAGDPDMLVRLRVPDVAGLQRTVNRLRRGGEVTSTKTLMVLDHRMSPRTRPAVAERTAADPGATDSARGRSDREPL